MPGVNFSRGKKISISGNPPASAKHVLSEVEGRRQVRIDLEENHGLRRQLPGLPSTSAPTSRKSTGRDEPDAPEGRSRARNRRQSEQIDGRDSLGGAGSTAGDS